MSISDTIRNFANSRTQTLGTSKFEERDFDKDDSSYMSALEALENESDWIYDRNLTKEIFLKMQTVEPKTYKGCLKVIGVFQRIFVRDYDYFHNNSLGINFKKEVEELITELENNRIQICSGVICVKYSEFPEKQFDFLSKLDQFFSKNYPDYFPPTHFSFEYVTDLDRFLNFVESYPNIVSLKLNYTDFDDIYLEKLSKILPNIEIFSIVNNNVITTLPKEILNRVKTLECNRCSALKTIKTNALTLTCSDCNNLETFEAPNARQINCYNCDRLKVINADLADIESKSCRALTAITTNGKKVSCRGSLALVTIQANNATEVDCSNCYRLKEIEVLNAKILNCVYCTDLNTIKATKLSELYFSGTSSLLPEVKLDLSNTIYENQMHDLSIETDNQTYIIKSLCRKISELGVTDYTNFPFLQLLVEIIELTIPPEFSSEEEKAECKSQLDKYLFNLFDYIETNFKDIDINKFKKLRKLTNPQQELNRIIWLTAIFATFESKIETHNPLTDSAAFETLSAINNLTDPLLRGEATRSLFSLYEDNNDRYETWNLTKKSSYLILISLFLSASNIDEKLIDPILKSLNYRYYQNLEVLNPILEMTSLFLKSTSLSKEEKEKIFKLILQLEPPKKARINSKEEKPQSKIIFNEKRKIYLENRESQKEWVNACKDILLLKKEELLKNIQTTEELLNIHKKICREFFGVDKEQSEYLNGFFKSTRYPNALFTYAARLQYLKSNHKSLINDMLKDFVKSCLKGEFPNNRYNFYNNLHLETIFSNNPLLLEEWKKPLNIPLEDKANTDSPPQVDPYVQIQHMVKFAIDNDRLKNKNELSEEFKTIFQTENYNAINQTIQTLKANSLPGFEIEIAFLNAIDPSLTSNQRILALKKLYAKLPKNSELKNEIVGMIKALNSAPKLKLRSIESAETWEDFLLMGTEVDKSCLSIDDSPSHTQCLLANIIDGKNKVIILKDSQGKIVARTVLRILLDKNYNPVLFMEKIYTKGSNSNLLVLITKGCEEVAKRMNLPLTKEGTSFGSLSALRGPAPIEYVDALGSRVTQQGFTIPDTVQIFPKKDE